METRKAAPPSSRVVVSRGLLPLRAPPFGKQLGISSAIKPKTKLTRFPFARMREGVS